MESWMEYHQVQVEVDNFSNLTLALTFTSPLFQLSTILCLNPLL
jgi:hypothetical protein